MEDCEQSHFEIPKGGRIVGQGADVKQDLIHGQVGGVVVERGERFNGGLGRFDPVGYGNGHFSGDGPFGAACEDAFESGTLDASFVVPERGVEDGALAVGEGHDHGFVTQAAAVVAGPGGVGRGEDLHVFPGTAHKVVEFVGLKPFLRHALEYGVIGLLVLDEDFGVAFVCAAGTVAFVVENDFVSFQEYVGAG